MSSSFGTVLRVSTFGESHGDGVGGMLEGCPAGINIDINDIQVQLDRRRPGQNAICTSRNETDKVSLLSGLNKGLTLGTPIGFFIKNRDIMTSDYNVFNNIPRPSHADYTYYAKYGVFGVTGGSRSSARETACRVVAGTIARKFLNDTYKVEIIAWVNSIGNIEILLDDYKSISTSDIDNNPVRCPDNKTASKMIKLIKDVIDKKDSIGGIITCLCRNVPVGWGEPVFDKLEAKLAHAMLSIPATKGFEIGSGFSCATMKGSQHNDAFIYRDKKIQLKTNHSGGVQGGISTGNDIIFKVAFKPTSSIGLAQKTVDLKGKSVILKIKGRHDACIVPRAVPIVEAMAALVLGDLAIRYNSYKSIQ